MTCECADRTSVVEVVNLYASCLDARDWAGLDSVFHPGAIGVYGGYTLQGRTAIVSSIAGFLDHCGPSQHLLGNHVVRIEGDEATSICKARVIHIGLGERAVLQPYEAIGTYRDQLARTSEGWRIVTRRFEVEIERGDGTILQPA